MKNVAPRLWCLVIGFVLCLTLAFVFQRMSPIESEPTLASSPPPSSPTEATVIEVRIARQGEIINGEVAGPLKRWVVRFRETTIMDGRSNEHELAFLVHSPSRDLGVSSDGTGQRGVLQQVPGLGYRFTSFLDRH